MMMKWIKVAIVAATMTGGTAWAYSAGRSGTGLPGALEKPVRVDAREGSTRRGPTFIYFGSGRRYSGGGPSFGK